MCYWRNPERTLDEQVPTEFYWKYSPSNCLVLGFNIFTYKIRGLGHVVSRSLPTLRWARSLASRFSVLLSYPKDKRQCHFSLSPSAVRENTGWINKVNLMNSSRVSGNSIDDFLEAGSWPPPRWRRRKRRRRNKNAAQEGLGVGGRPDNAAWGFPAPGTSPWGQLRHRGTQPWISPWLKTA